MKPNPINLKILLSTPPPLPNEFSGNINGPRGASHGEWKAGLCDSASELLDYSKLGDGVGRMERDVPLTDFWPVAYLRRFIVNRRSRGRGNGIRGMNEFFNAAREKGARIAFVWIGRDPIEDLAANRRFFLRRGWKILPADSNYMPILAYYEL